ncbi:MAG: hypothetical protein BMS9Abin25_1565 [Gammaproteobacteria bacterium]|nr:MAG: hypothetical protein BMS9Abin25_1565 [Gammaproteobacteria bacterium]
MVFGIFTRKSLLGPETTQWLWATFAWALKNFGTNHFYEDAILVTPTHEHFPDRANNPDDGANKTFERVKQFAGMGNWRCELEPQENDVNNVVAPTLVVQGVPKNPAGTFSVDTYGDGKTEKFVITYNPDQLQYPEALVATFAHELAHYLAIGLGADEPPPGGENYWEHATDLLAVVMGFGIFQANSAFIFQQFTSVDSQGWSTQQLGYLSESELTYALAIFSVLKNIDNDQILPHLDPHLRSFFKKARKEIAKSEENLSSIKQISERKWR